MTGIFSVFSKTDIKRVRWKRGEVSEELEMSENGSLLVKRERERELKKHQDRILNMKACVHSSLLPLAASKRRQPIRARIDKDKIRQIEKQNYWLLMRLRYIHKNYFLYMPRRHVYLQRGEAGRAKNPAKKAVKSEETKQSASEEEEVPKLLHAVAEEMANRVAAVNLWKT